MITANSEPTKPRIQAASSTSRRNKIIRKVVLVLLGLSACGTTILIGWVILMAHALGGLNFNISQCDVSNPSGIEEVAHFKFPPSAKILTSGCGGLQSLSTWTSFEMNPADLNTFLLTTDVKPPLSSSKKPTTLYCHCDDTTIINYLYGGSKKLEWEQEVFIDTNDKNLYTVYFTAFGD